MRSARERAVACFRDRFGAAPVALVRAPGRVNVIGEHTDYNDGFVLPAAVDRQLWLAMAAHDEPVVEAVSEGFDGPMRVALDTLEEPRRHGWGAFVQGVAWSLARAGYGLTGWQAALASDIPVGAGLSSSAAIELAVARAFQVAGGFAWEPMTMARIAQRAENDWVGVRSGIMDQVACAMGRAGHALLLDCRTLALEPVPLPSATRLVVLDTGTRRELESSAYGNRRRDCEAAAAALGAAALRDVTAEDLDARGTALDAVLRRRARHVVTENARTRTAAQAMAADDPERVGALMDASHASLRDDFEVSSEALDAIVGAARSLEGCYGARLTGGGFAGCAVALVAEAAIEEFTAALPRTYRRATGLEATVHPCRLTDGAALVDADER